MIRNGLLTISRIQMHLPNHIVSNDIREIINLFLNSLDECL